MKLVDIKLYKAVKSRDFYNMAKGGKGHTCEPWNKGKHNVQKFTNQMKESLEKGRHLPASEKLKEKLRNRSTLVEYTDEYRTKLSNVQKLNRTVNDGQRNIIVKSYELDEWLSKPGIKLGRVKQESSTTKG